MAKLSAAQRARIRRLSQPRELAPDEEGGELNIVPFLDIIMNILIFVLATVAVTFTTTIETTPPSASNSKGASEPKETLNMTVLIVGDGFGVKAAGGNVAQGCQGHAAGLAVPKKAGRYDLVGLTRCAETLKGMKESFADETQVFLSANNDTDYELIIQVMDALRTGSDGKTPLFPNVNFSARTQ
jgi:biopolymer transport protein TolR